MESVKWLLETVSSQNLDSHLTSFVLLKTRESAWVFPPVLASK